ncbi:MAG: hypothetical protein ACRD6N_02275, partial [Pyrinomonadaceae bacterium]
MPDKLQGALIKYREAVRPPAQVAAAATLGIEFQSTSTPDVAFSFIRPPPLTLDQRFLKFIGHRQSKG